MDLELCYLPACEALARFRDGNLSPVELVRALLERSAALNPRLNAFTEVFEEDALAAAERAEARYLGKGREPRPLEGVPLAIKDGHPVAGKVSTRGSRLYAGHRDDESLIMVERLLGAGAILFARTTTPEFGAAAVTHSPLWGVTRNPWNPDYTPGGSSGGAGAALAAGMVTIADGSDYGGSIRVPASCCGVFGYKPPYGRNPGHGTDWPDPFSHYGPLSRQVADAAMMQNVVSGQHPRVIDSLPDAVHIPDELEPIAGWRIAYSLDLGYVEVEEDVRLNTLAALEAFCDLGCHVEEVKLSWSDGVLEAFLHHAWPSFAAEMLELPAEQQGLLAPYTRAILKDGTRISPTDIAASMSVRAWMYERLGPILEDFDLFVCPTTAVPAVKADHDPRSTLRVNGRPVNPELGWVLTYPFNMLGACPVANVPSGFGDSGVPTGMQLVGRPYDDIRVFRAAADYERVRPWLDKPDSRPAL